MTPAVLYPGRGNGLDPADAAQVRSDLTAAMHAAGARPVTADLARVAELAMDAGEPVLICADNLVAHAGLLRLLTTEPGGRSTALVVSDPGGELRDDRGKLVRAVAGAGTVRCVGALCIAPADLPILAKVGASDPIDEPSFAGQPRPAGRSPHDCRPDLLGLLLDEGLVPVATPVRMLRAEQVHTGAQLVAARARVAEVDEDRALLRMAVKEKDDFFTTYAVSTWSPVVTRTAARLGLSPSAVTWISVLLAGLAALAFWQASRPAMIAGGVLLYLGFVLDCVDGQLARYTRRFGAFGGWLDTMADRAKEYAVYAGLAAGAERIGLPYAWPLAITAILLQTVRHMTDTWYGVLHDEAAIRPSQPAARGVGDRLSAASNRVQGRTGSPAYWLKRIVVFPIGERWALIAALAMITNGRVALAAVVGCGLLAFTYTLALRSLRSLSMRVAVLDKAGTARHRDDGPLVRRLLAWPRRRPPRRSGVAGPLAVAALGAVAALVLDLSVVVGRLSPPGPVAIGVTALLLLAAGIPAGSRHDGPLDWLVPAALRAGEYLFVVAAGLLGPVPPPVVFLLLFTLALRHYDLTARMEKRAPAGRDTGVLLGWDVRVLLLGVLAVLGQATLGEATLSVVVGGTFLLHAIRDWRRRG